MARGDIEKIKGIEGVSKARRALLPYGAIVLQEIIAAMQPSKIVVSALGVREGFLYSLLPPEEQRADPLISAVGGTGAAARPLGRRMRVSWSTGRATRSPPSASTRPRRRRATATPPACSPTSAGARIPNIAARSRSTSSRMPPSSASTIPAALFLALVNAFRNDGVFNDAIAPELKALATPRYLERARLLGGDDARRLSADGVDAGRHAAG